MALNLIKCGNQVIVNDINEDAFTDFEKYGNQDNDQFR